MNALDRDLLIEIWVKTPVGWEDSTGYPVARDRILTARHGLYPEDCPSDAPIRLRWFHRAGELGQPMDVPRRDILWESPELDVALIRCAFPAGLADWRHLSPLRPFQDERWASEGFPRGAGAQGVVQAFPVAGMAHSSASRAERIHLGLDDGFRAPRSWGGISGAPVFVRGQIVGVVVATPTAADARLVATPSSALFAAAGFIDALGYDPANGRIGAALRACTACLADSPPARTWLRSALGCQSAEAPDLASAILDLADPRAIARTIRDAHDQAIAAGQPKVGSVLRGLALIALPACFDEVAVESVRAGMADPERPVLTPPIFTATAAELALAAADGKPAWLCRPAPGELYPQGELSLKYPKPGTFGMDPEDLGFKTAWDQHLIAKFANGSETAPLPFERRARTARRRLQEHSERLGRTHYVLLVDAGNDEDNRLWERRAGRVRTDCPTLAFVRLSTDGEIGEQEIALLDPFCNLLAETAELTQ